MPNLGHGKAGATAKLASYALQELRKTRADSWSFLCGGTSVAWCCPDEVIDYEFDGDLSNLDLPWSAERIAELEAGENDPTCAELEEWRRALCRQLAPTGEANLAWIVPLAPSGEVVAWALFTGHAGGAPEDEPPLEGIFDTQAEALDFLKRQGEVGAVYPVDVG